MNRFPGVRKALAFVWLVVLFAGFWPALAQPPNWWASQGVLSGTNPTDYAPATQGQLKMLAKAAMDEMDVLGEAGMEIQAMVGAWSATTANARDYSVVTIGALKATARPFYDRLDLPYPWTTTTADDGDYAIATLGQVKNVFSFDLTGFGEGLGDGLPDDWKQDNFGTTEVDPAGDPDGDGRFNLSEYLAHTDPNSADGEIGAAFGETQLKVFTPLE